MNGRLPYARTVAFFCLIAAACCIWALVQTIL
jgi:uncharacterized membrane protein YqjE